MYNDFLVKIKTFKQIRAKKIFNQILTSMCVENQNIVAKDDCIAKK